MGGHEVVNAPGPLTRKEDFQPLQLLTHLDQQLEVGLAVAELAQLVPGEALPHQLEPL